MIYRCCDAEGRRRFEQEETERIEVAQTPIEKHCAISLLRFLCFLLFKNSRERRPKCIHYFRKPVRSRKTSLAARLRFIGTRGRGYWRAFTSGVCSRN